MKYNLIATGSEEHNALLLDNKVLVDIGTTFKKIEPYAKDIEYVCLTHHHEDHFNKGAIAKLLKINPSVIFLTPTHMVEKVRSLTTTSGERIVKERDILEIVPEKVYNINSYIFSTSRVSHANSDMSYCPNVAWKIKIGNEKILYVTDTSDISHLKAIGFNYYFIEMNYRESELDSLIRQDYEMKGSSHRVRSRDTHLAIEKAELFLTKNVREDIEYTIIPLHMSKVYEIEFNMLYEKGRLRK